MSPKPAISSAARTRLTSCACRIGSTSAREAADLVDEHVVRHRPAIEADLHHVGAGMLGLGDDALGHFLRRAVGQVLGLALELLLREVAEILAQQRRRALVLRPHVIGRMLADIARPSAAPRSR